jgi:phosphoribosylformylglycinamidine synthase PurS subunit
VTESATAGTIRVVVDVMMKPEILDPQGRAVVGALTRLGVDGVADVRQGKRFEITLRGEWTPERQAQIEEMAATLLSNPVIEDYRVHAQVSA